MISHTLLCGLVLCHSLLLSGAEMKKRSLHTLRHPQELEYVLKRAKENEDSKERRSNAGSSFIRFGRSEKSELDDLDESKDYTMDQPQTRSDIIIRYGRAEKKKFENLQKKNSQIVRFGRGGPPIEVDLTLVCDEIFMNEEFGQVSRFSPQLIQICNNLGYKNLKYNDYRLDLKQD